MHALEKMLARASGQDEIASGQSVWARIDLAEVNDLYPQTLTAFAELPSYLTTTRPPLL